MATGVRVTGLRKVQRALKQFGATAEDMKQAMSNVSNKVVHDAQALTPVRTGNLRASIRASKAQAKATIRGGNNSKLYYASFVEYGAEHNTAVEMVTTAVNNNQQYMIKQLTTEIKSLIRW